MIAAVSSLAYWTDVHQDVDVDVDADVDVDVDVDVVVDVDFDVDVGSLVTVCTSLHAVFVSGLYGCNLCTLCVLA